MITEDFVEQVIYHKAHALALKGSPYVTEWIQQLLDYRLQVIGENILTAFEDYAEFEVKRVRMAEFSEKLALYAAMDGGMDQPVSEEAYEALELALLGDG